ncbi:hypothetical protein IW15_16100 [Chryseobacterium soli]|uniref:Uncharacterized protein n=2 Tax=Chryseobacterium soli TaxID=445961 RepID=A0A086A3L1_9FLAO|nr:hypothetical protein IW15_16100 [Chryseobacterium soli]
MLSFTYSTVILKTAIFIMAVLLIILSRIRIFEFENSGMVITIQYHHPFQKKWMVPFIEFPTHLFHDFSIKNNCLYLTLRKENEEFIDFKVRLYRIGSAQIKKIQQEFEEIKN